MWNTIVNQMNKQVHIYPMHEKEIVHKFTHKCECDPFISYIHITSGYTVFTHKDEFDRMEF
jgi:hypothetical protein